MSEWHVHCFRSPRTRSRGGRGACLSAAPAAADSASVFPTLANGAGGGCLERLDFLSSFRLLLSSSSLPRPLGPASLGSLCFVRQRFGPRVHSSDAFPRQALGRGPVCLCSGSGPSPLRCQVLCGARSSAVPGPSVGAGVSRGPSTPEAEELVRDPFGVTTLAEVEGAALLDRPCGLGHEVFPAVPSLVHGEDRAWVSGFVVSVELRDPRAYWQRHPRHQRLVFRSRRRAHVHVHLPCSPGVTCREERFGVHRWPVCHLAEVRPCRWRRAGFWRGCRLRVASGRRARILGWGRITRDDEGGEEKSASSAAPPSVVASRVSDEVDYPV